MSLSKGDLLVKYKPDGSGPVEGEGYYKWEVRELSSSFQARNDQGQFEHVEQLLLVRKVE